MTKTKKRPDYWRLNPDQTVSPINGKDPVLEWGREFEKTNRRIAKDVLANGNMVSTVFLGLDHNWDPDPKKPPHIFETMVFPHVPWWKLMLTRWFPRLRHKEGWSAWGELDTYRTSTYEEALKAHTEACRKWAKR